MHRWFELYNSKLWISKLNNVKCKKINNEKEKINLLLLQDLKKLLYILLVKKNKTPFKLWKNMKINKKKNFKIAKLQFNNKLKY